MKDSYVYAVWGGLWGVCVLLGCIPAPEGALRILLTVVALAFFVPGGVLLYRGFRREDARAVRRIRILAAASLGLTLLMLIANFLSVRAPETVGNVLYGLLIVVSVPMVCGQYWVISLFLWSVLLVCSLQRKKRG